MIKYSICRLQMSCQSNTDVERLARLNLHVETSIGRRRQSEGRLAGDKAVMHYFRLKLLIDWCVKVYDSRRVAVFILLILRQTELTVIWLWLELQCCHCEVGLIGSFACLNFIMRKVGFEYPAVSQLMAKECSRSLSCLTFNYVAFGLRLRQT